MADTPRPSIRLLASRLGLSKTAVAYALRGSSNVSAATRERVMAEAKAMGYHSDAKLNQLMSYMRKAATSSAACNIAWLNTFKDRDEWTRKNYNRILLDGARARAKELGYAVDQIWAADPALPPKALNRILEQRGVDGVIIPSPLPCASLDHLNWDRLAVVNITGLDFHAQHYGVAPDHPANMATLCENLHALGYRRPGLWLTDFTDHESRWTYGAMFQRMCQKLFSDTEPRLPPNLDDKGELRAWYDRVRPDVVLTGSNATIADLAAVGLRVPEDVSVAHVTLGPDTPGWTGIDVHKPALGAAAVDMLIAEINHGEYGRPAYRKLLLIEGTFVLGKTAPGQPGQP